MFHVLLNTQNSTVIIHKPCYVPKHISLDHLIVRSDVILMTQPPKINAGSTPLEHGGICMQGCSQPGER